MLSLFVWNIMLAQVTLFVKQAAKWYRSVSALKHFLVWQRQVWADDESKSHVISWAASSWQSKHTERFSAKFWDVWAVYFQMQCSS